MNDFFSNRLKSPTEIRASRRFRYHVQTRSNPLGRVVRMPCVVNHHCTREEAREKESEAHHPDYSKWWIVIWACTSCHRWLDHSNPKVKKRWIFDYESLLMVRRGGWRSDEKAPGKKDVEVPF